MDLPGCEIGSGSMGYGLPFGVGFALAKKLKKEEGTVYVIMSDGEMAIGTTWESGLIAYHHLNENLRVIIDANGWQAMGKTNDVLHIEPIRKKWEAMGWRVLEIDGHNCEQIEKALSYSFAESIAPICIIARTVKGKGVSFMEDQNDWHYRAIDKESYELATKELGQ